MAINKVLHKCDIVRVDVRNFQQIDSDYVYGEVQKHIEGIEGKLCYGIRLLGTEMFIVVSCDKVKKEWSMHDNK